MKPSFVIIGGTGFIGDYVVDKLSVHGEVRVLHVSPLRQISPSPAFYYRLPQSGERKDCLKEIFAGSSAVIFLSQPNLETLSEVLSVLGSVRPIPKFLYASSSLIYKGGVHPQREEDPVEPVGEYEASKVMEEKKIAEFVSSFPEMDIMLMRLGNVYGDIKNKGMAGKIISAALGDGKIKVNGDGSRIRDFIFIDDVSEAIKRLVLLPSVPGRLDVVNITTGAGRPISGLIAEVESLTGKKIEREYSSFGQETESVIGDCSKLERLTGFRPVHDLRSGLVIALDRYTKGQRSNGTYARI